MLNYIKNVFNPAGSREMIPLTLPLISKRFPIAETGRVPSHKVIPRDKMLHRSLSFLQFKTPELLILAKESYASLRYLNSKYTKLFKANIIKWRIHDRVWLHNPINS